MRKAWLALVLALVFTGAEARADDAADARRADELSAQVLSPF